jgi:hypothetical protein
MEILIPAREAAAYIGVTPETLENWRTQGAGPAFVKTSPSRRGKVMYRRSDISAWQAANLYTSTSEVGGSR